MLKMRIIPCLDVYNNQVVKGVQFRDHETVGDCLSLAQYYNENGADELVFYDIGASAESRLVDRSWITRIAQVIHIPFCVAGGIQSVAQAESILESGADKISINSPALNDPELITRLAKRFGSQSIVVGIDSYAIGSDYFVYQYTGNVQKTQNTGRLVLDWAREVQDRGAGEIVLNCMNQDGMRKGYDLDQLALLSEAISLPMIASGGAGESSHFKDVFTQTQVTGALAASVFHRNIIQIPALKHYLQSQNIEVRI